MLLLGGLLAGLLLTALSRPVVRWSARRARRRAERRLTAEVAAVGREYVVTPVGAVLDPLRPGEAGVAGRRPHADRPGSSLSEARPRA